MNASIIWLRDIDHGQLELVGGKAANLGELAQIPVRKGDCRLAHHVCIDTASL